MYQVDARGLSCPQPVLLTKNALEAGKVPLIVLVETVTSRENVRRMAERSSYQVTVETADDEFKLIIEK